MACQWTVTADNGKGDDRFDAGSSLSEVCQELLRQEWQDPEDYGGEKAEVNVGIQNNVTVPDASEIVGKLVVEYPHLIDVLHNLDVDNGEMDEE